VGPESKWQRAKIRLENSLIGVAVLSVIAIATAVGPISDLYKGVLHWWSTIGPATLSPNLGSDLDISPPVVSPLSSFASLIPHGESNIIYPVGLNLSFDIRSNHSGSGAIAIKKIDFLIDDYQPNVECPFELNGDNIIGAGPLVPHRFNIAIAEDKIVRAVKLEQHGQPIRIVKSTNLLDTDPESSYIQLDGSSNLIETIDLRVVTQKKGQYSVKVSILYTTDSDRLLTKDTPSFLICRP
jgi:hypothetical protein